MLNHPEHPRNNTPNAVDIELDIFGILTNVENTTPQLNLQLVAKKARSHAQRGDASFCAGFFCAIFCYLRLALATGERTDFDKFREILTHLKVPGENSQLFLRELYMTYCELGDVPNGAFQGMAEIFLTNTRDSGSESLAFGFWKSKHECTIQFITGRTHLPEAPSDSYLLIRVDLDPQYWKLGEDPQYWKLEENYAITACDFHQEKMKLFAQNALQLYKLAMNEVSLQQGNDFNFIRNIIAVPMKFLADCQREHAIRLNPHVKQTLFAHNIHELSQFLELDAVDLQEMGLEEHRKSIAKLIEKEKERLIERRIKAETEKTLLENTNALERLTKILSRHAELVGVHQSISEQGSTSAGRSSSSLPRLTAEKLQSLPKMTVGQMLDLAEKYEEENERLEIDHLENQFGGFAEENNSSNASTRSQCDASSTNAESF